MDLTEISGFADTLLPVAAFRAHLRLGTGFADDASADAELAGMLRAAIATIEARTGKALFSRAFRLRLAAWRWSDAQALPVAPVGSLVSLTMIDAAGEAEPVDLSRVRLVTDTHRPRLVAAGAILPPVPLGGRVDLVFEAGMAPDWDALPADLRQAVTLLAARYYEGRTGVEPALPEAVAALLAPWRPARLTLGGGAA